MRIHDESKIHLVSRTSSRREDVTRIQFGDLIADILYDCSHGKQLYQWVVQRQGSNDVLGLGQALDFNGAKAQATAVMSDLLRNHKASQSGD